MNFLEVLQAIGLFIGGGAVAFILFFPQRRKVEIALSKIKEIDVDKALIEKNTQKFDFMMKTYEGQNKILDDTNADLREARKELETVKAMLSNAMLKMEEAEKSHEKDKELIEKYQDKISEFEKQIDDLKKKYLSAEMIKCTDVKCDKRKPPLSDKVVIPEKPKKRTTRKKKEE